MAQRTWDYFRGMEDLHREIDRLFDSVGNEGGWYWPFSKVSFLPGRAARAYPLINLSEDENSLYAEALAPGVDADTLKITLTGNQLTISGEKMALDGDIKEEDFHRNERSTGFFSRTLTLPVDVDESQIRADYRNGLLMLTMPKAEQAKPKAISVNIA